MGGRPAAGDATTANAAVAYGFDEGSGSAVSDASPNGRTGSVVSATWTASGRFGDALSFNGSSSRVVTTSSLPVGTSFSLTAWVYDSAGSGYQTIAAAGQARDILPLDGELWIYGGAGDIDPRRRGPYWTLGAGGRHVRRHHHAGYVERRRRAGHRGRPDHVGRGLAADRRLGGERRELRFLNGRIVEVRWSTRALTAAEISADSTTPVSGGTTP